MSPLKAERALQLVAEEEFRMILPRVDSSVGGFEMEGAMVAGPKSYMRPLRSASDTRLQAAIKSGHWTRQPGREPEFQMRAVA